jgi:pimeloyl-ACP methyl ester carboxylesterase
LTIQIVFSVESITTLYLLTHSFQFYTAWHTPALLNFPFRLHSLTTRTSPSKHISYWYRPHTAKGRTPILFIHGIGIGAYTHSTFIKELAGDDGIGVVALELPSISARLCAPSASTAEIKEEIRLILDRHGWESCTLIAHSYGTAVASTILRDPKFAPRIAGAVLMDPIVFMLHLPDVAFNFTRRRPRKANQRMLHYFASQDMLISHTLARRFFWSQSILFKEDIPADLNVVVTLSGKDLIVPVAEVWAYLTDGQDVPVGKDGEWEDDEGRFSVYWFDKLDHAGIFASTGVRRGVVEEERRLSARSA